MGASVASAAPEAAARRNSRRLAGRSKRPRRCGALLIFPPPSSWRLPCDASTQANDRHPTAALPTSQASLHVPACIGSTGARLYSVTSKLASSAVLLHSILKAISSDYRTPPLRRPAGRSLLDPRCPAAVPRERPGRPAAAGAGLRQGAPGARREPLLRGLRGGGDPARARWSSASARARACAVGVAGADRRACAWRSSRRRGGTSRWRSSCAASRTRRRRSPPTSRSRTGWPRAPGRGVRRQAGGGPARQPRRRARAAGGRARGGLARGVRGRRAARHGGAGPSGRGVHGARAAAPARRRGPARPCSR